MVYWCCSADFGEHDADCVNNKSKGEHHDEYQEWMEGEEMPPEQEPEIPWEEDPRTDWLLEEELWEREIEEYKKRGLEGM